MPVNFFWQILNWFLVAIFGLGGVATAPHSFLGDRNLAEATRAGQVGGDEAIFSASGFGSKTLPLAEDRQSGPRRNSRPDFDLSLLSAKAAFVLDKESGASLFEFNAEEARPIGSLTKLMTALVFLDAGPDWEKTIAMETGDSVQGQLYLKEGEQVKARDLFYLALVASSNNAALALARSTGLEPAEFVAKMNDKARRLGLSQTVFVEPTGLDAGNRSTAREAALLLRAALSEKAIQEAVASPSYSFLPLGAKNRRRVFSTNLLLNEKLNGSLAKINGGKTGFVEEAGYCFAVEGENEDGRRVIAVVLGSQTHFSRFSEAKALAEWALGAYEWPERE